MFPKAFHLRLVAMSYKITYKTTVRRARKLGISGMYVTDSQAFDIANYMVKSNVRIVYVTKTIEIIPSRLNYTTLEDL